MRAKLQYAFQYSAHLARTVSLRIGGLPMESDQVESPLAPGAVVRDQTEPICSRNLAQS